MTGPPTSGPAGAVSEGWLLVLPADSSATALERLQSEADRRGWRSDHSRGDDQTIVALEGPRALTLEEAGAELAPLLAGLEADVLPLLPGEHYARLRRRRRFLSALVTGLGLLIVAGTVMPLLAFLRPPPSPLVAPDLLRVGRAGEIPVGAALLARFRDQPIVVIHVAQGGWEALTARCTLSGDCLLAWDAARELLQCPCHGCRFDARGNVLHPPASIPLLRLEAFERDGQVLVRSRT